MSENRQNIHHKKAFTVLFLLTAAGLLILVFFAAWRIRHPAAGRLMLDTPRDDLDVLMRNDPDLMWVTREHIDAVATRRFDDGREVRYRVRTGAMGIRGQTPGPRGNRLRILAIGDSTTFGLGVDDEQTWCAQLQKLLDPDREVIEVVNAGVIGYSVFQCRRRFEGLLDDLDPVLTLVTAGHNDISLNLGYGDADTAARLKHPDRYAQYAMLRDLLFPERFTDPEKQRPRMTPGEFLDDLERLCIAAKDRQRAIVLVCWPFVQEVFPEMGKMPSYSPLIRLAAERTQTPLVDLHQPFRQAGPAVFLDNVHLTADGHAAIANAIADQLRALFKAGLCESWQRESVARAKKLMDENHEAAAAARLLRKHLAISPRAVPFELLGLCLESMGDDAGALDAWTSGMLADPGHHPNFDHADRLLRQTGPAAARDFWRQMTERLPESNLAWLNLGRAAMTLGFHEEAVAALETSLRHGPNNATALALLGEALELLGRNADAVAAYEKALSINPDIPNLAERIQSLRHRDTAGNQR